MNIFIVIAATVVALLHVYILILEMFLWQKPIGLKAFRQSSEDAKKSAVLAANQGLYNGFLAAGLFWGVFHPEAAVGAQVLAFFFACVTIAGAYGGFSVSRKILLIQALPGFIGFLLVCLA